MGVLEGEIIHPRAQGKIPLDHVVIVKLYNLVRIKDHSQDVVHPYIKEKR